MAATATVNFSIRFADETTKTYNVGELATSAIDGEHIKTEAKYLDDPTLAGQDSAKYTTVRNALKSTNGAAFDGVKDVKITVSQTTVIF